MISPVLRKRPKNSKTLKTLHPLEIIHFIHFVQEGAYAPLSVTACGRATSPAGGGKCKFVLWPKAGGKEKLLLSFPLPPT